ncbi:MAG: dolichyl-phosphate beta-glucosyltransferase [Bdellovibrio sp. ArHS]|uniref:dolichyl-phosphate beta-glucosyltransferase n=1 Tax=Bdellovibrio sp. ArHS TaxID=1569284 RepID=UPI0005823D8E|nr:dolichyl-phosphate beta-glucosyltransferase [Bdellovibrio sp. ArHS]KHD89592.1 MAG: dolichyl-phosphate beta-glucosyltransferase [Bdellovibrio sp. ArHS]
MKTSISIVIPAYNEERRLPRTLRGLQEFISAEHAGWELQEVLVVNDGSTDATVAEIEQLQNEFSLLRLISLPRNQGKGAAVHAGMNEARGEWILIADADMATPWDELNKIFPATSRADLVMGSRGLVQSQIERRQHWVRQNMGKTFNKIIKLVVGLPFQDTQCGFKLLRNDAVFRSEILPRLQVQRFAWDVELILLLLRRNKVVTEIPIRWRHQDFSHVHIVRDSLEMLWAVIKLKMRLRG